MKKKLLLVFFFIGVFISSCASVKRIGTEEVTDISGKWNDTDSSLVSQEMINDCLNRSWKNNFKKNSGRKPVVMVGKIKQDNQEFINIQTFINNIQMAFINSGKVIVVEDKAGRIVIRKERKDQASHASEKTVKVDGEEIGADFMLNGTINIIIDSGEDLTVKFYQINLELINIATNEKVWIGEKKIKKKVHISHFNWRGAKNATLFLDTKGDIKWVHAFLVGSLGVSSYYYYNDFQNKNSEYQKIKDNNNYGIIYKNKKYDKVKQSLNFFRISAGLTTFTYIGGILYEGFKKNDSQNAFRKESNKFYINMFLKSDQPTLSLSYRF